MPAKNFTIIPNVTPEELRVRKEEAIRIAVQEALKAGIAATADDLAVQDIAPEDLGLSGDSFDWAAPAAAGWNKMVNSVKADNRVVVFYGAKAPTDDVVVGLRFTQGQNKDLQIRGEYQLHTMYYDDTRGAVAIFPTLVKYTKDEYINIYGRFASASASKIIPLAVVVKPKSQVVG